MTTEMTRYKVLGKLPKIRNKYVKAVLVTKENKKELEKRFPAISLLSKPSNAYVVLKNPKQPANKQEFMFIPKKQFEMNAKETYKNTNMPIFKNVSNEEGDKLKAKYGAIVIDNSEEYVANFKNQYIVFTDTRCPGKFFMNRYDKFVATRVDFYEKVLITENRDYAVKRAHELREEYLAKHRPKLTIEEIEKTIKDIKDLEENIAKQQEHIAELKERIGVE